MTAVDWPTDGAFLLPLAAMPVPYELVIGRCSVEHVAERLGCDRGTSHQRRAASSVTFCDIVGTQCGIRGSPDRRPNPFPAGSRRTARLFRAKRLGSLRARFGRSITQWRFEIPVGLRTSANSATRSGSQPSGMGRHSVGRRVKSACHDRFCIVGSPSFPYA